LLLFALAMTASLGVKSAVDYSVFSASAGAFLLATSPAYHWTLDALLERHAVRWRSLTGSISRHYGA